MYHTIQFAVEILADLESPRKGTIQVPLVKAGSRVRTRVQPYVTETDNGPIEVADLYFEDGTAIRTVPFACFSFVDG